ncbi:MAG: hypothetical protein ACFB8W_06665 [Elainellaceae cyanobacterium]
MFSTPWRKVMGLEAIAPYAAGASDVEFAPLTAPGDGSNCLL